MKKLQLSVILTIMILAFSGCCQYKVSLNTGDIDSICGTHSGVDTYDDLDSICNDKIVVRDILFRHQDGPGGGGSE